jgi:hypothetical protein
MALIKLAFRSVYFIIYGQIIFLSWLFWLLIPIALMGFASPSSVSLKVKQSLLPILAPRRAQGRCSIGRTGSCSASWPS